MQTNSVLALEIIGLKQRGAYIYVAQNCAINIAHKINNTSKIIRITKFQITNGYIDLNQFAQHSESQSIDKSKCFIFDMVLVTL